MTSTHTYGPSCTLQPASNPFTRRASEVSNDAPIIRAHFFYSSDLPIDDPLSPVPPPISTTGPSKVPPRPFSVYDNIALEQAWQALQKDQLTSDNSQDPSVQGTEEDHHVVRRALSSLGGPEPSAAAVDNLTKIIRVAHERRSSLLKRQRSATHGAPEAGGKTVVFAADMAPSHTSAMQQDLEEKSGNVGDPHLTLCDSTYLRSPNCPFRTVL